MDVVLNDIYQLMNVCCLLQVYRYVVEDHYEVIAIVSGVVQTVLYCDFFYLYITKGKLSFINNTFNFTRRHIIANKYQIITRIH